MTKHQQRGNRDLMLQQKLDIQSKNENRMRIGINVSNDQYDTTEIQHSLEAYEHILMCLINAE